MVATRNRVVPAAQSPRPRFGSQAELFPVAKADEPLIAVGQECWIATDPETMLGEVLGTPVLRRAIVTHVTPKYFCARTVREFGHHGPMVTLPPGIKKIHYRPYEPTKAAPAGKWVVEQPARRPATLPFAAMLTPLPDGTIPACEVWRAHSGHDCECLAADEMQGGAIRLTHGDGGYNFIPVDFLQSPSLSSRCREYLARLGFYVGEEVARG